MYWSRTGSYFDLLAWLLISLMSWAGGWLICAHLFRLRKREQMFVGIASGLLFFALFSNLLAQVLPLVPAYWVAAGLIFGAGLGISLRTGRPFRDLFAGVFNWKQIALFVGFLCLFSAINRGLALFDDYFNLPLVSIVATGDVPPHFYLNPAQPLPYHYGLHLLAGSLVRIGGFFPWSALDISKTLAISLTVALGVLWFRRWMGWKAALLFSGLLILFAGGSRWLLLFLPEAILQRMSADVQLIGSGFQDVTDLVSAMTGPWNTQGDGPVPFPFAFMNGIYRPLLMAMGSGGAMPSAGLFLLLLLARSRWKPLQGLVYGLVITALALFSETLFSLAWGGIALAMVIGWLASRSARQALDWIWVLIPGALLAPVMGGVLTSPFQRLVGDALGSADQAMATIPAITLRWPPAILSAHLGELLLTKPAHLLIALAEIGPVLFLAPLAIRATYGYIRSRKMLLAGLSIMAAVTFFIPLFIQFTERDRDIVRISSSALDIWLILSVPYLWTALRRGGEGAKAAVGAFYGIVILGGIALFSIQLISIAQTQPSYYIQDVDAMMSRDYWNDLAPGVWILDPVYPYRPAALFGRTTGPAFQNVYIPLPEFRSLVLNLNPIEISDAGYSYIYLDKKTWQDLSPQQRGYFQENCARLVAEKRNDLEDFRRLYEITGCRDSP